MRKFHLIAATALSFTFLIVWVALTFVPAHPKQGAESRSPHPADGLEFRDGWELRWGQNEHQITTHLGANAYCRTMARNSMGLAHCDVGQNALPEPFIAGDVWFMNGRFFRAFPVFNPDQFDRVKHELEEKFGDPGASFISETQIYTGAKVPQVETSWAPYDVTIRLRLHDGEDGNGSVSMVYDPIANEPPPGKTTTTGY